MRSRVYSPSCPGRSHRPDITSIRADGRAECPVCHRMVKVVRETSWTRGSAGLLHRHGFSHDRWSTHEEMTQEDARVMLRGAQLEFALVNPRWLAAVEMRGLAAYRASMAGLTDGEIAEVYGIKVPNVHRMRERVARRVGIGDEDEPMSARVEV